MLLSLSFVKRILFFFAHFFYRVYQVFFSVKTPPKFPKDIDRVYVLLIGPVGIGDSVMLSPLLSYLASIEGLKVTVISHHPKLYLDGKIKWSQPSKKILKKKKSLLLAPTLAFGNVKYMRYCQYFLGYFFSNVTVSNVSFFAKKGMQMVYDSKREHYFNRTKVITQSIEFIFKKSFQVHYPILIKSPLRFKTLEVKKKYIVVAPYSNWKERQYPIEHYQTILKKLQKNLHIFIVGGFSKEEIKCNERVATALNKDLFTNLTGKISLHELNWLLEKACCFLGNDSGPSHLAFLLVKNVFVIFGAILSSTRLPLKHINVINDYSDGHLCEYYPCYNGLEKPTCKKRGSEKLICLKSIDPHKIYQAIFKVVRKNP